MKHIAYIHGLNSSPTSFSYIAAKLPKHKSHLITYKSHQPLAASIDEVLRQLPTGQQLTLVGHSLGGVIAALITAANPDLVESLITISSPLKGSRAAATLRWIPGTLPVFTDLVPRAPMIQQVASLNLTLPTLSIISTGGHLPTSPEANDSVVAVSSQKGLRFGTKVEVNATHFEVLMSDITVGILKEFIFGGSNA